MYFVPSVELSSTMMSSNVLDLKFLKICLINIGKFLDSLNTGITIENFIITK